MEGVALADNELLVARGMQVGKQAAIWGHDVEDERIGRDDR